MGRRVRRLFRGGRIVDLGAGHGLLAQVLLLLDDSSPDALVVDKALPPSSARVHEVLVEAWPRLSGRVRFVAGAFDAVDGRIGPGALVVSIFSALQVASPSSQVRSQLMSSRRIGTRSTSEERRTPETR